MHHEGLASLPSPTLPLALLSKSPRSICSRVSMPRRSLSSASVSSSTVTLMSGRTWWGEGGEGEGGVSSQSKSDSVSPQVWDRPSFMIYYLDGLGGIERVLHKLAHGGVERPAGLWSWGTMGLGVGGRARRVRYNSG